MFYHLNISSKNLASVFARTKIFFQIPGPADVLLLSVVLLGQNGVYENKRFPTVDGKKIRHHLGCKKPCKSWDKLPINWCRISPINSIIAI